MKIVKIIALLASMPSIIAAQEYASRDISQQELEVLSRIYTSIDQGAQELFMLINTTIQDAQSQEKAKKRIEELVNYYDSICFLPLLYLATATLADNYSIRFNKPTPADLQEIGVSFEQVSKNFAALANEFRRKAAFAYVNTRSRLTVLAPTVENRQNN